ASPLWEKRRSRCFQARRLFLMLSAPGPSPIWTQAHAFQKRSVAPYATLRRPRINGESSLCLCQTPCLYYTHTHVILYHIQAPQRGNDTRPTCGCIWLNVCLDATYWPNQFGQHIGRSVNPPSEVGRQGHLAGTSQPYQPTLLPA